MLHIGFVILHYLAPKDTIECIESILKYRDCDDCPIVVVDNASPDNSGAELKNRYSANRRISFVFSEKNLGFSGGNNLGINYARYKLNCDTVVVLNNDTYLIQDDFCSVIREEYAASHFGVLGPQVFDPEGKNYSSPLSYKNHTLREMKGNVRIWHKNYLKSLLHLENVHRIKIGNSSNTIKTAERLPITERVTGLELHGCCLVFSPEYFAHFEGFEELTFLYGEETILRLNCEKYGIKLVYNPKLKIFHKEAVSTKKEYKTRAKMIKHNRQMYKAAKAIYKKALREDYSQ